MPDLSMMSFDFAQGNIPILLMYIPGIVIYKLLNADNFVMLGYVVFTLWILMKQMEQAKGSFRQRGSRQTRLSGYSACRPPLEHMNL